MTDPTDTTPEQPETEVSRVETEIEDGIGRTVWKEPDALEEYEYGHGDKFVRWVPWGDERADDDVWAVCNVHWQFETTWITDRDNPTTKADHRVYELISRETMDKVEVPESELRRGEWKPLDEVDGEDAEGFFDVEVYDGN